MTAGPIGGGGAQAQTVVNPSQAAQRRMKTVCVPSTPATALSYRRYESLSFVPPQWRQRTASGTGAAFPAAF